jgi:TRAP transporter TAXI family solute receptor
MIKRQKKAFFVTSMAVAVVFFFLGTFSPVMAADNLPDLLAIGTYAAGSKGYAIGSGLATAIQNKTGIKVRATPQGTNVARVKSVTRGETILGALYETGGYPAQGGVWDFLEEGPQDICMAWLGFIGSATLITRNDSGIKTWEDIKGKRVANYEAYDKATANITEAMLAFGNVSYDDVKSVTATYPSGMSLLKDGKLDLCHAATSSATVYEMAAGFHGVYLFKYDPNDKEGVKRLKSSCPIAGVGAIPVGYGATEEKPINVVIFPGYFIADMSTDVNVVYAITKAIAEGYNLFKDVHPEAKYWSVDNALNLDTLALTGLPYHEGAVKAFKELGKWTERHEKWQQSRLAFREQIKVERKKVAEDAKANNKEFGDLWTSRFRAMRIKLALEEY